MSNKIKYLLLSTGYVESQGLSTLLVGHQEGFDTAEEAIVDFSAALKMFVEENHRENLRYSQTGRDCCKKCLQADKEAEFCSKCGTKLQAEKIEHHDVMEAFHSLMGYTLDDFGMGWEKFREVGWEVPCYDFSGGQMAIVTDFRPVISGLQDEDARMSNNEIMMSSIACKPTVVRKTDGFNYKVLPPSFIGPAQKADEEWDEDDVAPKQFVVSNQFTVDQFFIGNTACTSPVIPSGKIDTELCRKVIADMVKVNPDILASQYSKSVSPGDSQELDLDASTPKTWTRHSKSKLGAFNVREFHGCMFNGVLWKAFVKDDGKTIVGINLVSE